MRKEPPPYAIIYEAIGTAVLTLGYFAAYNIELVRLAAIKTLKETNGERYEILNPDDYSDGENFPVLRKTSRNI